MDARYPEWEHTRFRLRAFCPMKPLLKVFAFLILLVLIQGLVSILFPAPLPAKIVQFDRYLTQGIDLLYFGDSTLVLPAGEVTTGEILQELLPNRQIGQTAHTAYGLDLFQSLVAYTDRRGAWPRTLVLPVNMRSFSPEWDMRPAYQFEKETKILAMGLPWARFFFRPFNVFGLFQPSISQDQFLNAPVYDGDVFVGRVKDFESESVVEGLRGDIGNIYREVKLEDEEKAQAVLTYHYMANLKPDHRKLDAMIKLSGLAAQNGVEVILYISPINETQGERFLGRAFSERLAENIQVVRSRLEAASLENVTLLNLAFDLEAYDFVDMEHLTETGKEYVAEQLALAIQPESSSPPAVTTDDSTTATFTPEPSPTPSPSPTRATPTPTRLPVETTATPTATVSLTLTSVVSITIGTTVTPSATVAAATTETVTLSPSAGDVTSVRYIKRFWPSGSYPVELYRIGFLTVDEHGQLVETRADLYVPYVESETAFPVLGHAAGTTGIGNDCAPLDEQARGRDWGSYHSHSLAYAAQGYIVVFPNWLYFDDPELTHRYFIAEFQAHTLLDATRAVYRFWDRGESLDTQARPARAVFMMGYSSGGHAVFAAKDRAQAYAPELAIKGVIGFGPTTNPELLLQEDPIFGPYIVYAYRDFYGAELIDPTRVYQSPWLSEFENAVLSKCVDDIFLYYSHSARRMYVPEFRQVLYDGQLANAFPEFAEKLAENTSGLSGGTHIPVLILQGMADTVITPPSQLEFLDQLCALGNSVTWFEYEAVAHVETRWNSYRDVLAWMKDIVEGNEPRSDCPDAEWSQ
ncbi:MAG: hypothetical protein JXA89_12795 [Anaerolineae bacterium]|nr:hypothetical protein [Anaerolineae bacterium]